MRNVVIAGLMAAALPAAAQAVTYDAFTSFTGSSTAGQFTFGSLDSAGLFTLLPPAANCADYIPQTVCSGTLPGVYKGNNFSGAQNGSTVIVPASALILHPGASPTDQPAGTSLEAAVLFTAPTTGVYSFSFSAFQTDNNPHSVTLKQLAGTASPNIYTTALVGGLPTNNPLFMSTFTAALTGGQSLGFSVGNDGSYYNDSTGVNFSVASVPEPASWAMMVGGFGMLGFGVRATRRKATFA